MSWAGGWDLVRVRVGWAKKAIPMMAFPTIPYFATAMLTSKRASRRMWLYGSDYSKKHRHETHVGGAGPRVPAAVRRTALGMHSVAAETPGAKPVRGPRAAEGLRQRWGSLRLGAWRWTYVCQPLWDRPGAREAPCPPCGCPMLRDYCSHLGRGLRACPRWLAE